MQLPLFSAKGDWLSDSSGSAFKSRIDINVGIAFSEENDPQKDELIEQMKDLFYCCSQMRGRCHVTFLAKIFDSRNLPLYRSIYSPQNIC